MCFLFQVSTRFWATPLLARPEALGLRVWVRFLAAVFQILFGVFVCVSAVLDSVPLQPHGTHAGRVTRSPVQLSIRVPRLTSELYRFLVDF